MNYKILSIVVLALFLSLSLTSAITLSPGSATLSLTSGSNKTVTVVNDNSYNFSSVSLTTPYVSGAGATFALAPSSLSALAQGASSSFNIIVSSVTGSYKVGDSLSAVLNASGVVNSTLSFNQTLPVTFQKSFCRSGSVGSNLSITSVDIKNSGGSSSSTSDDTTWQLLDTVKVKVRVENVGDDTVRGINVVLGLFDSNGANRAGDLEYTTTSSDQDKVSYGSLKSGKDATITFEFKVPADFKADGYKLAVKAYSSNAGEDNLCTDTSSDLDHSIYQTISTETESTKGKYIAFDRTDFTPLEAACGDSVTLSTTAYNIGDEDQDRVKLTASNDELKFSESQEVTSGLNMGESTPASFTFSIPQSATVKTYLINLYADYDYKDGVYRQRSTNYATYQYKVVGGCGASSSSTTSASAKTDISASLSSSVAAGKPLSITATVTNRANVPGTFTIDASGFNSWATLDSQSDRALYLDAGQSKQVVFNMNVNSDSSGQNTMTINARNGQTVDSKDVVVTIPASSGFSLGGSNMIWVIAGVNLLLLVIIIVVAVRLANR